MTTSTRDTRLTLDFGSVGYHDAKEPFRIALDADALLALIGDARCAWRVYELALVRAAIHLAAQDVGGLEQMAFELGEGQGHGAARLGSVVGPA